MAFFLELLRFQATVRYALPVAGYLVNGRSWPVVALFDSGKNVGVGGSERLDRATNILPLPGVTE